jgi:hypothetical protein
MGSVIKGTGAINLRGRPLAPDPPGSAARRGAWTYRVLPLHTYRGRPLAPDPPGSAARRGAWTYRVLPRMVWSPLAPDPPGSAARRGAWTYRVLQGGNKLRGGWPLAPEPPGSGARRGAWTYRVHPRINQENYKNKISQPPFRTRRGEVPFWSVLAWAELLGEVLAPSWVSVLVTFQS